MQQELTETRVRRPFPTASEQQHVLRGGFGGVAEISGIDSGVQVIAATANLSASACFVRTRSRVPVGTRVNLKITHRGCEFSAAGKVTYVSPDEGWRIEFAGPGQKDEAVLKAWLAEAVA